MWLLVIVVGSGVLGLFLQNVVPRIMLEQVPAETIYSQIGHILDQYRGEAERLVAGDLRPVAGSRSAVPTSAPDELSNGSSAYVSMGTVRQVGRVQGKVVQVGIEAVWVPASEVLLAFFRGPCRSVSAGEVGIETSPGLGNTGRGALPDPQDPAPTRGSSRRRSVGRSLRSAPAVRPPGAAAHLAARLAGRPCRPSVALVLLMVVHAVLALKYV